MLLTQIEKNQISVNNLVNQNYWTVNLGIARTTLAVALLVTLLFNSTETLFYFGLENQIPPRFTKFNFISVYNLFGFQMANYFSIAVLLIVISGYYPRITCFFHWWISYSFVTTSYAIDGGDQINSIMTLLLIPICLTDKRNNHWIKSENRNAGYVAQVIAFFSFLIIQLQVAVIYFNSSVGKFAVPEWANGTAVYYWLTNQSFGMNELLNPVMMPILANPFFIAFITWGVLIFELFLFSCLFTSNKKIIKWAFILGIGFHFSIVVFHGLVSFFFTMAAALTLFLITKKTYKT